MRRLWLYAVVALPALAQEGGGHEEGGPSIWLVVNFILLAAALGFLIVKNAGPFYKARLLKIRQDMIQGEEAKREADQRAAEVQKRLANLDADIAGLRAASQKELEIELERMRQRTAAERERIRQHAEQEIAAAGKTARAELRRYSAELAIGLAERKIRARMSPDTQDALVRGFVEILNRPGPPSVPKLD